MEIVGDKRLLKPSWNILRSPKLGQSMLLEVCKMEVITRRCKIDKNICTDLLELMVLQIVIQGEAPNHLRPQTQVFLWFSLGILYAPFWESFFLQCQLWNVLKVDDLMPFLPFSILDRLGTDNPLGDQQLGFPILGGRTRAPPRPPHLRGGLRPPTPPLNVGLRPPQLLVIQ